MKALIIVSAMSFVSQCHLIHSVGDLICNIINASIAWYLVDWAFKMDTAPQCSGHRPDSAYKSGNREDGATRPSLPK